MEIPGYEPFFDLADAERLFRTERGSTYAHFADQTSQRNRSGLAHTDTTTGMQPRTLKTIYVDPKSANALGYFLQDESTATRLIPILDEGGRQTGRAAVQVAEEYTHRPMKLENGKFVQTGPERVVPAGTVLTEVPYEKTPVKGYHPVEIYSSESPKGSRGSGIHFGTKITEILERTGKGGGAGGGGGAFGQYDLKHGSKIGPRMASGGPVPMPDSYSYGRWRLI